METLISALIAIIGGLGFLLFKKSKQNNSLKSDIDLTKQSERSNIVDENVEESSSKLKELEEKIKEPVDKTDKFWKDYGNEDR